jgi:hypothetical protein
VLPGNEYLAIAGNPMPRAPVQYGQKPGFFVAVLNDLHSGQETGFLYRRSSFRSQRLFEDDFPL